LGSLLSATLFRRFVLHQLQFCRHISSQFLSCLGWSLQLKLQITKVWVQASPHIYVTDFWLASDCAWCKVVLCNQIIFYGATLKPKLVDWCQWLLMRRQRGVVKWNFMSQQVVIARIKVCVMGLAHIQRKGNYPGGRLVENGCTWMVIEEFLSIWKMFYCIVFCWKGTGQLV
jgi:hypothetical protein